MILFTNYFINVLFSSEDSIRFGVFLKIKLEYRKRANRTRPARNVVIPITSATFGINPTTNKF